MVYIIVGLVCFVAGVVVDALFAKAALAAARKEIATLKADGHKVIDKL